MNDDCDEGDVKLIIVQFIFDLTNIWKENFGT